jgi:hypothetical protein
MSRAKRRIDGRSSARDFFPGCFSTGRKRILNRILGSLFLVVGGGQQAMRLVVLSVTLLITFRSTFLPLVIVACGK